MNARLPVISMVIPFYNLIQSGTIPDGLLARFAGISALPALCRLYWTIQAPGRVLPSPPGPKRKRLLQVKLFSIDRDGMLSTFGEFMAQ